jgi:DNA primase
MISQNTIDRIFESASVEDVVGEVVNLKKAGSNLKGLCPFHNEKTPSFSVSPAKGIYKCFGCGKAGNVVNFVMETEQLTYVEALRKLAAKYNVPIEEDRGDDPQYKEKNAARESISVALEFAAKYFADILHHHRDGKMAGYSYLRDRGLRDDIIETFGLGYSLESRSALLSDAIKKGFEADVLLKAGLIKEKEDVQSEDPFVRYYDAFRDRVMFPIYGITGKVLGFGGRRLKEGFGPKYLNSAETEFYHKSEILYGLFQAKKAVRELDDCILVEGYLDVITLFQNGIENVVASSGTALTEGQVRIIKRFTENITVLYDADPAGQKASMRSIDLILQQGMNISISLLPEGEDPDTLCKKMGGEAFRKYITDNSVNFVLFKARQYSEEAKKDPVKKTKAVRDILDSIVKIPDPLKRAAFIHECALILDADERIMTMEAGRLRRKETQSGQSYTPEIQDDFSTLTAEKPFENTRSEQERMLIRNLIRFGHKPYLKEEEEVKQTILEFIIQELTLDEVELENVAYQDIITSCKKVLDEGGKVDEDFFIKHPSTSVLAAEVLTEKYVLSPTWAGHYEILTLDESENFLHEVTENINYLKLKHLDQLIVDNASKIESATEEEDRMIFLGIHSDLLKLRLELAKQSGIVILR